MDLHAPNGQWTLLDVNCTKPKCSGGDGQPGELRIRQDPTLAQRVAERERVLAAAIAALLLHLGLWAGQGWRGQL